MSIKFYVDAGANLFGSLLKEKNCVIGVLPMTLDVGGKCYTLYEENIDIDSFSKEVYSAMRSGTKIKTSLVNVGLMMDTFEKDVKEGNEVICFTMSGGISGTNQAANIAANDINERYKKNCVVVIDSMTAGFGEGKQALEAYELFRQGKSFEEIVEFARNNVQRIRSEFMVDDPKYLISTGRISALVAKIANVLNIKILLKGSSKGKIESFGKVRGRMMAMKSLAKTCLDHCNDLDKTIFISHCDAFEDAKKIKEILVNNGAKNVEVYHHDIVTGAHLGPGALAIFYNAENRD